MNANANELNNKYLYNCITELPINDPKNRLNEKITALYKNKPKIFFDSFG